MVTQVLYLGRNLKLAKALLAINPAINTFEITHIMCVNDLECIISEQEYHHFICELPVSSIMKLRIAKKFPQINCTYLTDQEPSSQNFAAPALEIEELISADVKAALDCISIPIFYKNEKGNVIACNTYFSQIFGLLPEDFIGQSLESLLPRGFTEATKKSTLTLKNPHLVNLLECEMRDVSGIKREFLVREEIIDGSELTIGMLFDVSEVNAIKQAVEKERVMLRATADISSDLIFFKDLNGAFIGCNKAFEAFVGCPEASIIGKKDEQLFEAKQAKMCQSQDALVLTSGEVYTGNEHLTYKNGRKHYIHMQKVPLKDKQGEIQGLIAIGRDITEKNMIQKQLNLANVVFENSRDGILVTDGMGAVITSNDACVEISGYSKKELLHKKISSFAFGCDYRRLFVEIERALIEEGKWQGNANFRSKNGDLGYFWLEIYEVKHRDTGVKNRVYSFTDLTQNKYNEEKIQYLSKHDSLTGLSNRIALFNHLETAIARANYKEIALGVLFVEINGFKAINERYGHNQGDLVIKCVAHRLKKSVSDTDTVARIGDDQFVLVIEELENEQVAALIAQKIAQRFSSPISIDGIEITLSPSIGISICPDDGMDLDAILNNAESAMLRSRKDKNSLYHFYTNELTIHSTQQIELENEFKLALEDEQFEPYYQPQYDLNKRQVVAVECSFRWNHPDQGVLLPDRFLMLAEQSGLLIDLGMKMFYKTAKQAVKWHSSGIHFGRVAISLSKLELSQLSLIGQLQEVLLETGCQANWLEFIIEESLFSSSIDTLQDNLFNISRLGISLTVDGFGADRSVLYSIGRLNIDKFKISKHFIQGVPGYLAGEAMIKSVFILANSLGIDVVGEGGNHSEAELSLNEYKTVKNNNEPMKACEATFYLRCNKRK
ncbi:diguanylate cyclase [Psychromonas sp. RZ22]|uniref:sensor domain-containing protein n=1 Tax=Psychromonas algarum TaxID=2555643 RepID=UPI001067F933|nr:EAL domain-containing protein [Psychromonas sp. RZ22]TEW55607.1 diguanylate cyclase [Psychromonas sp. RZ22]